MTRIKILIVDDEPLAREIVGVLLARDPEVEVVGECANGVEAIEAIRRTRPDIVFLDIEMPEVGGIDLADRLGPEEMPVLVFVTAFDRYATRAFEVEALDYLLKPFSDQRFVETLERAKRRVRGERLNELAEKVADLSAELQKSETGSTPSPREHLERLAVKSGGRTVFVKAAEIRWIESQDYYVRLHTAAGSHLLRASLASLDERLDPRRFLRIHRKAIVNVEEVRELEPLPGGAWAVVLSDGVVLRISRSRRRAVDEALMPRISRG